MADHGCGPVFRTSSSSCVASVVRPSRPDGILRSARAHSEPSRVRSARRRPENAIWCGWSDDNARADEGETHTHDSPSPRLIQLQDGRLWCTTATARKATETQVVSALRSVQTTVRPGKSIKRCKSAGFSQPRYRLSESLPNGRRTPIDVYTSPLSEILYGGTWCEREALGSGKQSSPLDKGSCGNFGGEAPAEPRNRKHLIRKARREPRPPRQIGAIFSRLQGLQGVAPSGRHLSTGTTRMISGAQDEIQMGSSFWLQ